MYFQHNYSSQLQMKNYIKKNGWHQSHSKFKGIDLRVHVVN